jgi:hypothetical protein
MSQFLCKWSWGWAYHYNNYKELFTYVPEDGTVEMALVSGSDISCHLLHWNITSFTFPSQLHSYVIETLHFVISVVGCGITRVTTATTKKYFLHDDIQDPTNNYHAERHNHHNGPCWHSICLCNINKYCEFMLMSLNFVVQVLTLTKLVTFLKLCQQQLWKIVIINNFAPM